MGTIERLFYKKKAALFVLVFFILLIYGKTIFYGYNIDDYIINDTLNGKINSFTDLFSIFKLTYNHTDYRPIVFFSFGLEQLIFNELNPNISHAVNLILYFIICVLALQLFHLLLNKEKNIILFFAVLLFCVLPINTKIVCSIKCRDNLLSMLFGLISTIYFIQFLQNNKLWYFVLFSLLFSLIAILSKKDAIGFWLFIFCYILLNFKIKNYKIIIVAFITFVAIQILESSLTEKLLFSEPTNELKGLVSIIENPLALDFTFTNRIVSFTNTVYYYFTKLLYLSPSKYYYGYNYYNILSVKSISFFCGLLISLVLIVALIYSIIKKNKTLSISIFGLATLSFYALNFLVPVAGIIADRYIFLASLFFCLLVAYLIYVSFEKFKLHNYFAPFFLCIILTFSLLTFNRTYAWKDQKTLIDTDAPKLYTSYEAMRIASGTYYKIYQEESNIAIRKEFYDKVIFYSKKSIEVYPKNYLMYLFIGQYYFEAKDYNNAISSLKISIQNDSTKAGSSIYLGDLYYSINKLDSALYFYKNGLKIDSTSNLLINNISTVYYSMNDKENCIKFNNDIIQKNASLFAPYENLGYYFLEEKDTIKAASYFKTAIKKGLPAQSIPIKL